MALSDEHWRMVNAALIYKAQEAKTDNSDPQKMFDLFRLHWELLNDVKALEKYVNQKEDEALQQHLANLEAEAQKVRIEMERKAKLNG